MKMKMSKRLAAAAMVSLLAVGCGGPLEGPSSGGKTHLSVARPEYTSLEAVGKASDLVVLGEIVSSKEAVDDGGSATGTKFPILITEFVVERSTPGDVAGSTIKVALPAPADPSSATQIEDDYPQFALQGKHVLFLDKVTEEERGGLKGEGTMYVPVGSGVEAFTVEGDTATSLRPGLRFEREGGEEIAKPGEVAKFRVDDLLATKIG